MYNACNVASATDLQHFHYTSTSHPPIFMKLALVQDIHVRNIHEHFHIDSEMIKLWPIF